MVSILSLASSFRESSACGIVQQRILEESLPIFVTARPVVRTFAHQKWTRSELPDGPFSTSRSLILPRMVRRDLAE